MFVGHYAVAFSAKRFAPRTSLGWTFVAVQLLDVIWAPFILLGIERARVVPGFLPASSLDLFYIPWTHSLVMAFAWSWVAYRLTRSKVIGACVFSHWLLDLVAHDHDLPLYRGAPYVGFGLWRSLPGTFWTEAVLLGLGLWIYLRSTTAKTSLGRFGPPVFAVLLLGINYINLYGAVPHDIRQMALSAEALYIALAAIAWWLDKGREPSSTLKSPSQN